MSVQHFLTLDDLSPSILRDLIDRAIELKADLRAGKSHLPLKQKSLAMIFSKSSTRTRVSFEVGMRQLGGGSLYLSPSDTQIGRGEPIKDTARVVSSMVDGIMIRTSSHADVEAFAHHASVPVINGLTDYCHPCQLLADVQTFQELRGDIQGATIAWIGDGNNVCNSFMNAARVFGFTLHIATPAEFAPTPQLIELNKAHVKVMTSPQEAVRNADAIVTDTWASMGQESERAEREAAFRGYCVDQQLMNLANKDALFLHCLPAYRGFEVTDEVIEGTQSAVLQEAENRLHAQKALLEYLLT
ncbi:ornithine carbamoyltransferase, catabolic [Arenicella chitinivorans]|uniref:Ornithine carbamoyltransferase n=1 Tax=Arenicella chitinivorans TaxID=1329800 RepID=A0A918RTJ5_9GAMM|nr:ornithine carbamoyltransferase [Arenicella chitinivorans]GHA10490.1 ornithine carbamoyltransferase, catabolic [Arenicella chitinivorans]